MAAITKSVPATATHIRKLVIEIESSQNLIAESSTSTLTDDSSLVVLVWVESSFLWYILFDVVVGMLNHISRVGNLFALIVSLEDVNVCIVLKLHFFY